MRPRLWYMGAFAVAAGSFALSAFLFRAAQKTFTEVQA